MNIYVETVSAFHVPGAVMDWMSAETIQTKGSVPPHPHPPGWVCVRQAPCSALISNLPAVFRCLYVVTEPGTALMDPTRPTAPTLPVENAYSTSTGHLLHLIFSVQTEAAAQIFTACGSWTHKYDKNLSHSHFKMPFCKIGLYDTESLQHCKYEFFSFCTGVTIVFPLLHKHHLLWESDFAFSFSPFANFFSDQ